MQSFTEKYNDKDGSFYKSLYPIVKKSLEIANPILIKCVKDNDQPEWSCTIMALRSIGKSMCYPKLSNSKVSYKVVSEEGRIEIQQILDEILKN